MNEPQNWLRNCKKCNLSVCNGLILKKHGKISLVSPQKNSLLLIALPGFKNISLNSYTTWRHLSLEKYQNTSFLTNISHNLIRNYFNKFCIWLCIKADRIELVLLKWGRLQWWAELVELRWVDVPRCVTKVEAEVMSGGGSDQDGASKCCLVWDQSDLKNYSQRRLGWRTT